MAVFQQKVAVFRCGFLDAGKSNSDTRHPTPANCNLQPVTLATARAEEH